MDLNVRVEKDLPSIVENAVSFETGADPDQLMEHDAAYEHHGVLYNRSDLGALPRFYQDLIEGMPMPLTFATPSVKDVDTLVAIALFLHRDLAIHPNTPSFVYTTDFVHRMGVPALAHLDDKLARFYSALRAYFPDKGLSQRELSARLQTAVGWVREYIYNGTLPFTGTLPPPATLTLLEHAPGGFIVAEYDGPLLDGWVELFRRGFLCGVLVGPAVGDRRRALIGRKSHLIPMRLPLACRTLNQMEAAMGEPSEWKESHGLWLESPVEGSLILVSDMARLAVNLLAT